jgi:hypothetical protein
MKQPTLGRLIALGLAGALLGAGAGGWAQDRGAGSDRGRGRQEAAAPRAEGGGDGQGGEGAGTKADTELREEGGEKVKVFKFTGLDISGRLKSPSLLYYLNRLRAEFDRPRLPHRTFVPELVRSTKGKAFR